MAAVFGTANSGSGSVVCTINSVPSGAMIGVLVAQYSSSTRTYTASSNIDGALTSAVQYNPLPAMAILYKHAASAGNHTITVSANTGTTVVYGVAFYETGLDSGASPIIPAANGWDDGGNANTHYCADTTELDTSTGALIVCAAVLNSGSGVSSTTAGSSPAYTEVDAGFIQVFFQYRDAASAATDDRGTWTSAGTARQGRGTMAAFPYASGGVTLAGSSAVATWTAAAGTVSTRVSLSGVSAAATWTVPAAALGVRVGLSGASATAAWAVPAGTLATRVSLSGGTATAAWTVPAGTLSTAVSLSGGSAIATWTAAGGSLATQVALSGASASAAWTVPTNTLSVNGQVTLDGASAVASWAVPAGTLSTQVALSGASAVATWTVPAGTLSVHVDLSGASASATWALPAGAFATRVSLTGSGAVASWAITAATLTTSATPTYDSIRVGTVRSGQAGASAVRSGQSGASAVRSGQAGASAVRTAYD